MEFRLIVNRLIEINKTYKYEEYKGALEMYDFLTQKNLRSTCVEVLLYLRKCENREFFLACSDYAESFHEFVRNAMDSCDTNSKCVITDILNLYANSKVMDSAFKMLFKEKTEASIFNAKFNRMISKGCNQEDIVSLYFELRKNARLMRYNDDSIVNTSETYLFQDGSKLHIVTYNGRDASIIVSCKCY